MKPNPTQFGVRENTASPRQHDSRGALQSVPSEPQAIRSGSDEDNKLKPPLPSRTMSPTSPPKAAYIAATGGEARHQDCLLTVQEVSELLKVPVSWVYGRTRRRSSERLPGYRLGKYWRFRESEVIAWLRNQRFSGRADA